MNHGSASCAASAILTRELSYQDGETQLTGIFHWPDTQREPRPGVLLIHGGAGLDEHAREQAHRYAELGYPVLAADMYGAGVAGDRERIMACVTALRDDPSALVRRSEAGLAALSGCAEVGGPLAVLGFCFGGLSALTLARSGADLASAVSIHGSLSTVRPAEPGSVRAEVLVCHGAADPHVPMTDVVAFTEEINRAGVNWQLVVHGGAMHGFTHRTATQGATPGVAYDPVADRRPFVAASEVLRRTLGQP